MRHPPVPPINMLHLLAVATAAAAVVGVGAAEPTDTAVVQEGVVRCFLADGTASTESEWPEPPADLGSNVRSVTCGWTHTCAIDEGWVVHCWGSGPGTKVPTDIGAVREVSAGTDFTCAITIKDDVVVCWGSSDTQGEDDANHAEYPHKTMPPPFLGPVKSVYAGLQHACAITKKHSLVICWGKFYEKRDTINPGFNSKDKKFPADLGPVKSIAAGNFHTCAIDTSDSLRCWGYNKYNQSNTPTNLTVVKSVDGGGVTTCAVDSCNRLWCWDMGYNCKGTISGKCVEQVQPPADLDHVKMVASGQSHSCAIDESDNLQCWGPADQKSVPPPDLGRVKFVDACAYRTCVITTALTGEEIDAKAPIASPACESTTNIDKTTTAVTVTTTITTTTTTKTTTAATVTTTADLNIQPTPVYSYGIIGGVAVVLIGMSVLLFCSCRIWKRKQQRRHVALENEVIADANAGAGVGVGVSMNNPGFVGIALDSLDSGTVDAVTTSSVVDELPAATGIVLTEEEEEAKEAESPATMVLESSLTAYSPVPANPNKKKRRRKGKPKFVAPAMRLGRATQAARGLADMMGYDDMSIIQHIMATGGGVDAIINEIMWNGTAKDKQNLQELLDGTYQINDTDASPEELAARRMTLDEVMETEQVKASKLLRAHVLSIRLYSTSTHASINDCLRTDPSTKPHPLAATTYYISEGIKLLRSVAGELPGAHQPQDFWRGMKDLTISDAFLESGGTEFACMSTTLSQETAFDFAFSQAPMILKLETKDFMSRGADISFLSVYPGESETLFPPLTFLRPIAKETIELNGKVHLMVRCEPVIP